MKTYIFKFLALVLIIFFVSCREQLSSQPSHSAAIDSAEVIIKSLLDTYKTPGVAVSVSVAGELVWSEGFGYADIESQMEVDPSITKFRIGSVSKTLTATALGKLYEEGKIDFDALVQVYTPYFPEKRFPITVRQVAGHTAGIRHYRGNEFFFDKYYPTVREGLTIFEDDSLLFEPDTDYRYSSYGWNLISAIVEEAAQQDFLDYMTMIFSELGMTNTVPDVASEDISGRTSFYYIVAGKVEEAPYVDNSYKWAGGGFIGTSEDLVRFGNAHLYNTYYSEETFNMLTTSHHLVDGSATNYGIGWRSGVTQDSVSWVGHSGGSVGGITMFAIYPEDEIVIALCSNSSNHQWNGIHHTLASLFAEDE